MRPLSRLPRWRPLAVLVAVLAGTGLWLWHSGHPPPPAPPPATAVSAALGGGSDGAWARAYAPRPFTFPADHGAHADFRNEWWYVTGHLRAADGRRFGYQFTLFRIGLHPGPLPADSAWRAQQWYLGHFAISALDGGRHQARERYSRAALDLAGATREPLAIWLEDWRLDGGPDAGFPMRLRARDGGLSLDLQLTPLAPVVLQGEDGLSRKSSEPGNASYYYSFPRLASRGTLSLDGRNPALAVEGTSWLDREWSTSALGPGQSGWDWFALQLADGRNLMLYRLRRSDGTTDPHSAGTLSDATGRTTRLTASGFTLTPEGRWTSPDGAAHYPAGWRLDIPSLGLKLRVRPQLADQEMRLSVRYWEGAVAVDGHDAQGPVHGEGYLEMTRYEDGPAVP